MAISPITSWQINRETMETVTDFTSLGSKITADGDCSHEIKRHLLLARKAMTNLDSILKSINITLMTKLLIAKFRLILKKVGKTTRPFRYDLNQILYDYTVEVTNKTQGITSERQSALRTMGRGL